MGLPLHSPYFRARPMVSFRQVRFQRRRAFPMPLEPDGVSMPRTAMRDMAHGLLSEGGGRVTVIHDSPGFVAQRMIATIVDISCEIAQMQIATPGDIEKAVRLGLAYPRGPLEFGDGLGGSAIQSILENMLGFHGDPRFRPSPWLLCRARLGVSLTTPEA